MIRIQITSPFRYQFRTSDYDTETKADRMIKDHFLTAGSYYTLDPIKDRAEVKFILSPNFVFKSYIYVNTQSIPADIAKELDIENGFYDEFTLPKSEEYIPTLIQDNVFLNKPDEYYPTLIERKEEENYSIKDAEPNYFDKTSSTPKEIEVEKDLKVEEKLQGALNTPDLKPLEEPFDDIVEIVTTNVSRESRKKELDGLHYMKIKDICEIYNIEYSNKKEVITQILDLEFGDPDSEFDNNIVLDNEEKGSPTFIDQE